MKKLKIYLLKGISLYINKAFYDFVTLVISSIKLIKINSLTQKVLIVLLLVMSCKSAEQTREIKVTTTYGEKTEATTKPTIEFSVGPDIEIKDAELNDFREFEVWVTTKFRDTIGNCRLKKVHRINRIDTLSHFFVRFKTLPIVYKMKIDNNQLVFAKINRNNTN